MTTNPAPTEIRPVDHPCAWTGSQLAMSPCWQRELSARHVEEIMAAARDVIARDKNWRWVTRERFPLDSTAALLEDISNELEDGCGMVCLRGLPVAEFDEPTLRVAWTELGAHLGTLRRQNADGEQSEQKRLLYRLWLSVPNSRPLPEHHSILWGNVEADALRGGIG